MEKIMAKRWTIVAVLFGIGATSAGIRLLTAEEPLSRGQRVSPKQLQEAMADRLTITATTAPTMGHTILELRAVVEKLEKSGNQTEAGRVNGAIKEMIRRAEQQLADKKAQVAKLNEEIDELKWAIGR
jgi:chromosome segregation ATPase